MIDCLDKQQQQQQQREQVAIRQEPVFWMQQQRAQPGQLQHHHRHQQQPATVSSNGQQMVEGFQSQQNKQQQQQQLLVDIEQSGSLMDQIDQTSQRQQSANNELIGYYFGSISRETAEWILKNHGNRLDGAYLLRSSGPKDDFVLSLMVVHSTPVNGDANPTQQPVGANGVSAQLEVLHYKIVETDDSFVALHGQIGDEKFATIDELIEKAQGVATKPKWPIQRQSLESQILPPTFWGLTVDQIRLAILIKAKQWGFPLSIFQQPSMLSAQNYPADQQAATLAGGQTDGEPAATIGQTVTTLDNETIRTLIYKSLHEFQPWFHGRIGRDEAERRIEDGQQRDGRFLVRERDNFSYAMCISHKRTTKHYRIDVLSTGELAIQDGRKFTSLMALVSHYTIMSDGLWCALTEPCPRPIQQAQAGRLQNGQANLNFKHATLQQGRFANQICSQSNQTAAMKQQQSSNNIYCVPPSDAINNPRQASENGHSIRKSLHQRQSSSQALMCPNQGAAVLSIKAPIKEWLHTINHKWSQLIASKTNQQHQSLNSFLFGPSNPLNNHCRHRNHHHHHHNHQRRACKNGCSKSHQGQSHAASGGQRQHKTLAKASSQQQQQQNSAANTATLCNCCFQGSLDGSFYPSDSLINNRHATLGANGSSLRSLPVSNMMLQLDQTSAARDANLAPTMTRSTAEQTKAFLSCLPQNSGFMLDSQSFVGSPLFVVKPNQGPGVVDVGPGLNAPNNVTGSGSSGSGNSAGGRFANNVEKLISPAQSISANLNGHQSNPYALNTDIYGSQTSTAIVNDHLLTSSSSSSGNNLLRDQQQQQQQSRFSMDMKQHRNACQNLPKFNNRPPTATIPNRFPSQQTNDMLLGSVQNNITKMNGQARTPNQAQLPQNQQVSHAGPILCGQHAGPAYRYTNCTGNGDSSFRPCLHSASLGLSNTRAIDDLHLPANSTQFVGPAALTKFVQFQDGQCLRTHRDTKSIQMAYLMSRQEALNVLNNKRDMSRQNQSSQQQQNQQQLQQFNYQAAYTSNGTRNGPAANGNVLKESTRNNELFSANQQVDFDLIDCDGTGFQFKYDPKLIKSSSIETLCGVGDDDDENIMEDLSRFKTNSELLMSLQPFWSTDAKSTDDFFGFSTLIPMSGSVEQQNSLRDMGGLYPEMGRANDGELNSSTNLDGGKQSDHFEENWSKKHNLEEKTTSVLADLNASLKAQVELKNKRSGLCAATALNEQQVISKQPNGTLNNTTPNQTQTGARDGQNRAADQSLPDLDPLELINEFDTLIRDR